jgi:cytochrome c biogenesis protein CcdA
MTNRTPYTGLAQKLVLGIDIGTTFGALSFWCVGPVLLMLIHLDAWKHPRAWKDPDHFACNTVRRKLS